MANEQEPGEQPKRRRGRPPGPRKTAPGTRRDAVETHYTRGGYATLNAPAINGASVRLREDPVAEQAEDLPADEGRSPFSELLSSILRRDRSEIGRVARELDVAENTVYRWMNGSSEPRPAHLKRLPEVLLQHRADLIRAIDQTFPGILTITPTGITEVPKDIYSTVLALLTTVEDDIRFWEISRTIFEYALQHLDADHQGLAITYAKLMPAHPDGIHSLYETVTKGSYPWPDEIETRAYLGSTTLAGTAATFQRMQIWDSQDVANRLQVEVDDFEASACAVPVMRGGRIAGVMVVSSTQPGFFSEPMARQAVNEFTQLLAIALPDRDFQSYALLDLRPMPSLKWQRAQITRVFVNRVINCVRKYGVSKAEAELRVQQEMELEFEEERRHIGEHIQN
jgi:transcriptional regulator with XRE-family HTH domain